jgi:hypothetical protein
MVIEFLELLQQNSKVNCTGIDFSAGWKGKTILT